MTSGAAELLEGLNPSTLRGRALIRRHLGDNAHRLQRRNASLKPLRAFLALLREAQLAPLTEVSAEYVSLNSPNQEDAVRIPNDRVLLDHVPGVGRTNKADAEVVPLRHNSISNEPVPTEPVAAGAAGQSYAAAGIGRVSISY